MKHRHRALRRMAAHAARPAASGRGTPGKIVFIAMLALLAVTAAVPAGRANTRSPFKEGEQIVFRLRWGFIVAGKATLKVHETGLLDGVPAQHFSTAIRTTGLADKLYKVRTRIDSFVSLDGRRVLAYTKKQHEGKERNHFRVDFDWNTHQAVRTDLATGRVHDPIQLEQKATDLIGALYRFRTILLPDKKIYTLAVTDGKKIVNGQAQIIKRQKVKVPAGRFVAYKVAPRTADLRGVFEKDDDADLFLWFTADERRIPVRVASAVMIGNFIAEAVAIDPGE